MASTEPPLSASQRSKIRRLSAQVEAAPGDEAGELNIIPYLDIITNILVFVLATISVIFLTSVDTTNPSQNSGKTRSTPESKALNLTILIVKDGVSLKTGNGNVAPGCAQGEPHGGSGIAAPNLSDGKYDWATVKACARALKSLSSDYEEETQVTIAANPGVEFRSIMDAVDALRNDDKGELFPDIHFGVPK